MLNRRIRQKGKSQLTPQWTHSLSSTDEDVLEPGESLSEAESEIGQNPWIDPETGGLAEGEAPPHLDSY